MVSVYQCQSMLVVAVAMGLVALYRVASLEIIAVVLVLSSKPGAVSYANMQPVIP